MWSPAPEKPNMQVGELHVWRASLDVNVATLKKYQSILSKEEIRRANKFRFDKDRNHFITARGILRQLLANYLQMDPAEVVFHYGSHGKPGLNHNAELRFNLSHSAGVAILGFVRDYSIGIDLEKIKSNIEFEEIANHFFAKKEITALLGLPIKKRALGFFNCWTRKEAFIKAKGSGLSFPLDQFEVSLLPDEPAKLLETYWDKKELGNWSLYALDPGVGFVGAVAINGPVNMLRYWQWDD